MPQAYREALARAKAGEVVVITMPWNRPLKVQPGRMVKTVTKAMSSNREALEAWCRLHRGASVVDSPGPPGDVARGSVGEGEARITGV